ncbi:MAG: glycosyltransferase [Myxococcales bacterium]|nr:glycosyltransferase [Myxococcota bacterium]MDW8280535.1 glycosyltransferase [Myxococcales bacterium]
MARRRRVVLFADGGFLAHTTRALEVGRALHRAYDHEVIFCCSGPYSHLISDAGFPVRPVFTVDREETLRLAKRAGLVSLAWWREMAERSVASDVAALEALRPDVVVGDFRMSLATSARQLRIPYVAITNAAWTSRYAERIHVPEGHLSTKLLGYRLADAIFPAVKRFLTWYWARGFDRVRQRAGLPPLGSLHELVEGDITLLADVPEYFPISVSPLRYRYVGPILWRASLPRPPWLQRLDRSRPTLYFTMGSTGDASFFSEAVRVFGRSQYQVLITTGGLKVTLDELPDNIFVEEFADGDTLMSVSNLVVSHGGNGTIYQALSHGVPVLGVPTMFDQEINLQRVEALGCGRRMERRHYNAERLREAVEAVLSDESYRRACMRMQRRIAYLDGPRRAAVHINHLLCSGQVDDCPDNVTHAVRALAGEP